MLAEAGVEACVVEAGLGGRHDATRVINARVVGLTNVGLDHQRVLGDTRELILAEKLAVLEPGAALCVGVVDDELYAEAAALAEAGGRDAASASPPGRGTACRCPPPTCATTRRSRCASPSCCSRRASSTASAAGRARREPCRPAASS